MTDNAFHNEREDFRRFADILRKGGKCIVAPDVFNAIQRFVPELLLEFGGAIHASELCKAGSAFAISKEVLEPLNFEPVFGEPHFVSQRLVSWIYAAESDSRKLSELEKRLPDDWHRWNNIHIVAERASSLPSAVSGSPSVSEGTPE